MLCFPYGRARAPWHYAPTKDTLMNTQLKCNGDTHVFPYGSGFCQCGDEFKVSPIPKELAEHYGATTPIGWACPKCERVFAPSLVECPYCGPKHEPLVK